MIFQFWRVFSEYSQSILSVFYIYSMNVSLVTQEFQRCFNCLQLQWCSQNIQRGFLISFLLGFRMFQKYAHCVSTWMQMCFISASVAFKRVPMGSFFCCCIQKGCLLPWKNIKIIVVIVVIVVTQHPGKTTYNCVNTISTFSEPDFD